MTAGKSIDRFLPRAFITLALSLVCALPCAAEQLTWEECIKVASEANPELSAARAALLAAELNVRAARGAFFPQLSTALSSAYGESSSEGGRSSDERAASGDRTRRGSANDATLSLTQPLFTGYKIEAQVEEAAAAYDASRAQFEGAKARVSFDLKSAAANLWYSQEYVTLSESIIKRREENLRLVDLRFESGLENRGSLLLSKASLSDALFDRKQAQDSGEVARTQLARVLGRFRSDDLVLRDAIPERAPVPPLDYLSLLPDTIERRLALAERRKAQAQLQLARSRYFPLIDLTSEGALQRGSASSDQDGYTVGARLTFPLYTGGTDQARYQSARAALLSAEAALRGVEQQLLAKLRQSFAAYEQAVVRERVSAEFVEAARVRAEISRSKYNNGLLSFEDWDIIESDLISRQKTYLLTRRDRVTAEAAWEQALGKGALP